MDTAKGSNVFGTAVVTVIDVEQLVPHNIFPYLAKQDIVVPILTSMLDGVRQALPALVLRVVMNAFSQVHETVVVQSNEGIHASTRKLRWTGQDCDHIDVGVFVAVTHRCLELLQGDLGLQGQAML
jgi:hypothetical protein